MAESGNCKHKEIIAGKVLETKKHGLLAVRIRKCPTCGSRVKTVEETEMVRLAESRFAQQEMKRLADELRELDQMAKGAKEAMAIFMRFAEWERSKDEDPIR
ncbi:hypothetical protein ES705_34975 [subsurface metagenome]